MPYPNEHACRLKDPGGFQKGSFRRIKRGNLGIIIARPKGTTKTTAQAYRYPTANYTAAQAKAHCKKAGGSFAAATGEKEVSECEKATGLWRSHEGRDKVADQLSLDMIRSALYAHIRPPSAEVAKQADFYVKDVYTDHAIVEGDGKLWKVPFSMGDEGIEFGEMTEVRIEYVAVKWLKALMGRLLGQEPAEDTKAKWTTAYINNLPDSAFLHIEAGGKKDEDGKTVPRSLRHLPVKDAEGKFDIEHVRNAIGRAPQAKDKNGEKFSDAWVARMQTKARGILESLRKKMPEGFSGFKVFEQPDGSLRWLSWTSNAFQDREQEIFATKALEEYASRAMDTGRHGELWLGHIPVNVGIPDGHIVLGRFLVETGPFGDTEDGKKAATFLAAYKEPLEMSHRYQYIEEDRADKVYEWLDIVERSVLPAGTAANLWTSMATITEEVKNMAQLPEKVVNFFKEALGEERWEQVKDNTEALTKALEAAGVEYKLEEEVDPTQEKPVKGKDGEPAVKVDVELPDAVTVAFAQASKDFEALEAKVEPLLGIPKAIEELTAKVEDLAKSDAEKIKAMAQEETPRVALWRASQADETKLTAEKEKELGEGPTGPPQVVREIADRVASGA